jgi:radical S-adenosyl methionine domain-containing protein 2
MNIPTQGRVSLPVALNWHFEPRCNYRCKFCFAHFADIEEKSDYPIPQLYADLYARGVKKITFVGGEPMLDRRIDHRITLAAEMGFTTCLVTNGTKVTPRWLEKMREHLHWIGFSIDASNDHLHALIGRGRAGEIKKGYSKHLERSLVSWAAAKSLGYNLKLNTVVCNYNKADDMSELVARLAPDRWKVFQALPIKGENDDEWDKLEITSEEFRAWVARHRHLEPVVESNDLMTGSYCMLDGKLRFYNNVGGEFKHSAPIPEVGMDRAWSEIESLFSDDVFEGRGGVWSWEVSK